MMPKMLIQKYDSHQERQPKSSSSILETGAMSDHLTKQVHMAPSAKAIDGASFIDQISTTEPSNCQVNYSVGHKIDTLNFQQLASKVYPKSEESNSLTPAIYQARSKPAFGVSNDAK